MKRTQSIILLLTAPFCRGLDAGPTKSNLWTFSTNVPFALTVNGLGLSSSDTLRILEAGSSCTDNSGNPVSVVTSMMYNCPDIGSGCSWMRSVPSVNIATLITGSTCTQFSSSLVCGGLTSTVASVIVSTTGSVNVTMNSNPNLKVGDYIVINSGISCGSSGTCTTSMVDLLLNGLTATNGARVGNAITAIFGNSIAFSITSFANANPPVFDVSVVNPPTWTRTSRQDTAVGLVGTVPKSSLVVCWNKGGTASGYHTQIGLLSIVDAVPFKDVALYPYGTAPETTRFIVTLSTDNLPTYSATPASYSEQSALILTWTQPTILRPIPNVNPAPSVANTGFSQSVCGMYLDELWSNNRIVGFPMPYTCSLRVSSVGGTWVQYELVVLFAASNGLPPSSDFIIVFRGAADHTSILSPATSSCCSTGTCMSPTSAPFFRACQYMRLTYIPTYSASPYRALQSGFAQFSSSVPASFDRASNHPFVASVSMNMFTTNNLLLMGSLPNLLLTFTAGTIAPGYFVRILPNPVLIWRFQAYCSGTAAIGTNAPNPMVPPSAISLTLCVGIEIVPNSGMFTGLKFQIPPTLPGGPITGPTLLFVNLVNIPMPSGGTFGAHFNVQISDLNDQFPHLTTTTNTYLKLPDPLRSVARITPNTLIRISSFVNQQSVFPMQIVPALPLSIGDIIKVTAPAGFTCTGMAASSVPVDLYANAPTPSGYGIVIAGTYRLTAGDSRSCEIELGTAVQQRASLMFTLSITNSATPILITNPANIWMVYFLQPSVSLTFPTGVFATNSETDWQSNYALLSLMSNYHMEPMNSWVYPQTAVQATARQFSLFFAPGTPVIGSGYIVIALPFMFTNATEYMRWGDLDDYMYNTGGPNDRVIHRLPPHVNPGIIDVPQQFAFFQFNGSLVSSWTYGFWIEVKPVFPVPVSLMLPPTSRSVWHIRTMYSQYGVVGAGQNPKIIPLFEGVWEQPKFYLAQVPLAVSFSSLVPFSVSAIPATVTLSFTVPSGITTAVNVRISGPSGFDIVKSSCVTVVSGSLIPICAGTQIPSTNILLINSTTASAGNYVFQLSVQVPDRSPTKTLNKWRIEFGHLPNSVSGPLIAESSDNQMDARILGILNGAVVPESVVIGDTHFVQLTLETISAIPSGGAIAFNVPSSIATIFSPCLGYLVTATGAVSTPCSINTITTAVFPGPWSPSTRTFYLKVTNVADATFVTSVSGTPPCYATACFKFQSLSNVNSLSSDIDNALYVVSYSVLKKIPIGAFAPLTNTIIQQFVGVNNRPLNRNNFVLSFSVLPTTGTEPVANPPFIQVRAPPGFEFDATCTGTVGLLPNKVFSDTMPWPPQYVELTSSTTVTQCIGMKNVATIYLSTPLAETTGTLSYAIRLGVAKNPSSLLPIDSKWYVQVGSNQATSPFDSVALSIMDPEISRITPSVIGYRVDLNAPIQSQLNPITIVLKPTTSVSNPGAIVIQIPTGTGFRFDPGWSCLYLKFSESATTVWDQASILCQVPANLLSLSLTVPKGKTFSASTTYTITSAVFNPTGVTQDANPSGSIPWVVGTFLKTIPLDQSVLSGFPLIAPIANISVTPNGVFGGKSLIPDLTILIQAQLLVPASTVVQIQSPVGFTFITNSLGSIPSIGGCFGLKPSKTIAGVTSTFSGNIVCSGTTIQVTLPAMNSGDRVRISLEAINPATTPAFPNFWYFSSSSMVFGGATGWTILPQLSDVTVTLDGPNYAINAYSHLTANFSTVQECNMVRFEFPIGFDLSAGVFSVSQTINGLPVTDQITKILVDSTKPHIVTLTVLDPVAGNDTPVSVKMDNVKLGPTSGSVEVNIVTLLDDIPVDQFTDLLAFILAGKIRVVDKLLSSPYREKALSDEPLKSNLIPLLTARTAEIGIVHLSLFFSFPVLQNQRFFVESYWYGFAGMNRTLVSLIDSFSQTDLGVSQIMLLNNSMMFTVNSFIPIGAISILSFPVQIPRLSNEAVSNFLIRSYVPGSPGPVGGTDSYPYHSNDNVTEGFMVTSPLNFTLTTPRSPPSAVINVSLNVLDAGYRRVFTMQLVSPSGYYFQNGTCLVNPGNFSGLTSCITTNGQFSNNRSSAILNFESETDGLTPDMFPMVGLVISIVTPSVQPAVGNWYLFGRGLDDVEMSWGLVEDPFIVRPIEFFNVEYSSILNTRTPLAVSFEIVERVPANGLIRLYYPDALTIDCTTFTKGTLPFYDEVIKNICEVTTNPQGLMANSTIKVPSRSFTIKSTRDLIPGNFTFTIDILTPTKIIAAPKFSLSIIGPNGNVYGSVLNVTGPPFGGTDLQGFSVASNINSRFLWYPSMAQSESVMTVGFSLMSQQVVEAGKINSIMVYFPDGFVNAISVPSDLVVANPSPMKITGIDFSNRNFLVMYIDQSDKVTTGQFSFQFPVYTPAQVPPHNVWFLCACNQESCTSPFDTAVMTYFPIVGFGIGQINPLTAT